MLFVDISLARELTTLEVVIVDVDVPIEVVVVVDVITEGINTVVVRPTA
jgi:hypothetical protein